QTCALPIFLSKFIAVTNRVLPRRAVRTIIFAVRILKRLRAIKNVLDQLLRMANGAGIEQVVFHRLFIDANAIQTGKKTSLCRSRSRNQLTQARPLGMPATGTTLHT